MEADDAARASSPAKYKNSPPAKLPISFDGDGAAACDDGADDDARLAAGLQQAEYDDDDAAGADLPPALPLTRSASMSDIDKVWRERRRERPSLADPAGRVCLAPCWEWCLGRAGACWVRVGPDADRLTHANTA